MQTLGTLAVGRSLVLVAVTTVAVACADSNRQMTTLPAEGGPPRGNQARATVVLFKVAVEEDGTPVPGMVSPLPRWKWHYLVNVGPMHESLDSGRAFATGQLDSKVEDAGWGFVTLPPGTYQLAFAAFRTRFAMPGAKRGALGYGQSSASRLEIPAGADLLYVGTFAFGCHKTARWWGYVEHECTQLRVGNDEELAREVASTYLSRVGALQTLLVSTAPADASR